MTIQYIVKQLRLQKWHSCHIETEILKLWTIVKNVNSGNGLVT
jgi:hypothetical protein